MRATFVSAMLKEFKRPNQSATDFAAELRALTKADKLWFCDALEAAGYIITNRDQMA